MKIHAQAPEFDYITQLTNNIQGQITQYAQDARAWRPPGDRGPTDWALKSRQMPRPTNFPVLLNWVTLA
jgi:hypothetical protein